MTRVLVTGAAGFLGRWFVRHHIAKGDWVLGVDDLSNPHSYWPDELSETYRWQGDAGQFFDGLIPNRDPYDIAYHLAAPVGGREKIEGDPLFNSDSLRLDSLFFRWAINRVGIAVYPSSSAVYGTALQEGMGVRLYEDMFHPRDQSWQAPDEMYGTTKMVGEYLAWKAAGYGLNTLCIRPFSGYGEGQSMEYPVPSILKRAKEHQDPLVVWGTGMQARDFVHVEDLVGATVARLNAGVHGYNALNIASGHPVTFYEIAKMAGPLAHYNPEITTDTTKPSGVSTRYGDATMMSLYYKLTIPLAEGLKRVLDSL